MAGSLSQPSIESYITKCGEEGHYLLASDEDGRWYWAPADGERPDPIPGADFRGPYLSRGAAIMAGEDWVEGRSPA